MTSLTDDWIEHTATETLKYQTEGCIVSGVIDFARAVERAARVSAHCSEATMAEQIDRAAFEAWEATFRDKSGFWPSTEDAWRAALQSQQATAEPVEWVHDCSALCVNNLRLWVDICPHCGKPCTATETHPANCIPLYTAEALAAARVQALEEAAQCMEEQDTQAPKYNARAIRALITSPK